MAVYPQDYLSQLGSLGLQQSPFDRAEVNRKIAMMNAYSKKIVEAEKSANSQKPQPKKSNPVLLLLEI